MGRRPNSADEAEASTTARFEALYQRHVRSVTAYCARRLPGEQVADAVADTFLVVWRRIDDVPDGDAERPWLYRVAYRVVGHGWRSTQRRHRLGVRVASLRPVGFVGTEEAVVDGDDVRRVLAAVDRLKPTDAEVLRLSVWERLGPAEIADVLEINVNAVHQRLHRAKQHLSREYDAMARTPKNASVRVDSGGER